MLNKFHNHQVPNELNTRSRYASEVRRRPWSRPVTAIVAALLLFTLFANDGLNPAESSASGQGVVAISAGRSTRVRCSTPAA